MYKKLFKQGGFTTVEMLVTITILAVLMVLVVLVVNPVDLLKQGRDSNRVAALNAVNNALRFLTENEPGTFIGTSSIVYVSIPSAVSDCSNLGLPTLPSGWNYGCVQSSSSTRVDGTGWIPVNFQAISAGSPISQLPIDSKNSTSTRNYFTYVASGSSWELAFSPEGEKNKLGGANNLTVKDGGQKVSLFELGKDLSLLPIDYGDSSLVGYWDFEEATGTIVYDKSGKGGNGAWYGSGIHYASGRVGNYSGQFSFATADYVFAPDLGSMTSGSYVAWVSPISINQNGGIIDSTFDIFLNSPSEVYFRAGNQTAASTLSWSIGTWHQLVMAWDGSSYSGYIDEKLWATGTQIGSRSGQIYIGWVDQNASYYYSGLIDDVRIYNRALSATEVKALYGVTQQ